MKGQFYYWYMVLDVFSRKIVGHEIHVAESAELASLLMRRASLAERLAGRPLVLQRGIIRPILEDIPAQLESPALLDSLVAMAVGCLRPPGSRLMVVRARSA